MAFAFRGEAGRGRGKGHRAPGGAQIGIYAGAQRSGIMHNGVFTSAPRDLIKERVRKGEIRVLIGTDSASEGLNLQRLGTLINLDLPWNPSRLEQRKGRIQRIGQLRDTVDLYNLRYAGSVEDRVHELLSERLEHIANLSGRSLTSWRTCGSTLPCARSMRPRRPSTRCPSSTRSSFATTPSRR